MKIELEIDNHVGEAGRLPGWVLRINGLTIQSDELDPKNFNVRPFVRNTRTGAISFRSPLNGKIQNPEWHRDRRQARYIPDSPEWVDATQTPEQVAATVLHIVVHDLKAFA